MTPPPRFAARHARILAALALLAALSAWLVAGIVQNFPNQVGMDLYHPWGIAVAREMVPDIRDPYVDTYRYGAIAAEVSGRARATDPKLWVTGLEWQRRSSAMFEPTGTPFYYAGLSWLPRDYQRAQLVFAIMQYAAFLGAIFWLARMAGAGAIVSAAIAAGMAATFSGFIQDIKFGNINSLQLAFLTAMIAGCRARLLERSRWFDRAFLPLLALFFVFKPNLPLVVLALALHYLWIRGPRATTLHGLAALATAALAAGAGAAYFGGWHAWIDWIAYASGKNGGTLLYKVEAGNQSLPMLMAEKSSAYGAFGYSVLLIAAFAIAFVVAGTASGKRGDLLRPMLDRVLGDAWFAVSAAVVVTCATAPLFWHHYYVSLTIAGAFLLRRGEPAPIRVLVCLTFLALAVPCLQALGALGLFGLANTMTFFAWGPMVPALIMEIARQRRAMEGG